MMSKINRHRVRTEDMIASMQPTKKQTSVHSPKLIGNIDREVIVLAFKGQEDYWDTIPIKELGDAQFPILDNVDFDNGNMQPAEDRIEALAKIVKRDDWDTERYYIKTGPDARFVNPIGLDENSLGKRNAGELIQKFRIVNKKAFILYIRFLQTKNKAYLYEAEREMA